MMFSSKQQPVIAVIGLGYVGLPLAIEFAKKYKVIGYDIGKERVEKLKRGNDSTKEIESITLQTVLVDDCEQQEKGLQISAGEEILDRDIDVFILTVPTPVDEYKTPDLSQLLAACKLVGRKLAEGNVVIFESTVYPGCTEEDCVPVLEQYSGLKFNKDFFVGYSPERINPGDKVHTLTSVMKVTSGSTPEIAVVVDSLYKTIITAGTHLAPSIKVAEASKAIENAQRDVNISFVNELALIFDRVGIDTTDVLEAAGTKYNFLKYRPGLVGGHCISVDPYYLAHKATQLGYYPQVILSGRRVNDFMAQFIASKIVKLMISKGQVIKGAKVLILGITFKENCPDVRNTKVVDIYRELQQYGLEVDIYDPWADKNKVMSEFDIDISDSLNNIKKYNGIVVAVAHNEFKMVDYRLLKSNGTIIFDVKGVLDRNLIDGRL